MKRNVSMCTHHFVYSDVKNQFHPGVSKYFDATRKNYAFFNPGVNFAPVLKTGVK